MSTTVRLMSTTLNNWYNNNDIDASLIPDDINNRLYYIINYYCEICNIHLSLANKLGDYDYHCQNTYNIFIHNFCLPIANRNGILIDLLREYYNNYNSNVVNEIHNIITEINNIYSNFKN